MREENGKSANVIRFITVLTLLRRIHITTHCNCYSGNPVFKNMLHYPPSLNPFLADDNNLFSDTASFYSVDLAPSQFAPPPLPAQQMTSNLKLPSFWPDTPVAWFATAEAQFQLRRIHSQAEGFCHVTAALDKSTLKKVVNIIVSPDPVQPFNKLKEALLASHILTDFQKVELILAMELLGARKPSELLADMLELCPAVCRSAEQHFLCCPLPLVPPQGDSSPYHPRGPL